MEGGDERVLLGFFSRKVMITFQKYQKVMIVFLENINSFLYFGPLTIRA